MSRNKTKQTAYTNSLILLQRDAQAVQAKAQQMEAVICELIKESKKQEAQPAPFLDVRTQAIKDCIRALSQLECHELSFKAEPRVNELTTLRVGLKPCLESSKGLLKYKDVLIAMEKLLEESLRAEKNEAMQVTGQYAADNPMFWDGLRDIERKEL